MIRLENPPTVAPAGFTVTRESTATTVNHVGGYASSAQTIVVASTAGFSVGDLVTIETTVPNALSFTWYEQIFNLEVQSLTSTSLTFTSTLGKQGCNNGDRVLRQNIQHFKISQTGDGSYTRYQAHFQSVDQKSINTYNTGIGNPTTEGFTASGFETFDENGIKRIYMGHANLGLTKSPGTAIQANILRGVGGIALIDDRLVTAGTGRMRVVASLNDGGILLGMPNTDAGADDIYQQTRGGSIQVVGDSSGRDAFRVDHNQSYRVTIGSQNLGNATANPSASISSGATTVSLNSATIEPRYGFTYLGNFTTGATVIITEAGKVSTTSVITANREAATLTLATPAADNYTTAAVITQQTYTPNLRFVKGSGGAESLRITGASGNIVSQGTGYFGATNSTDAGGSTLSVQGNVSIGSTYDTTAAQTDGLLVEGDFLLGLTSHTQTSKFEIAKTFTSTASGQFYGEFIGVALNPASASSSTAAALGAIIVTAGSQTLTSANGIYGFAQHGGTNTLTQLAGLIFSSQILSSGDVTSMYGASYGLVFSGAGNATTALGMTVAAPTLSSTGSPTTMLGLQIGNQGNSDIANSAAILINDQSGSSGLNAAMYVYGGSCTFNVSQTATADFNILGDTDANLFFADVSADTVQIGAATASDSAKFYVSGKISCSGESEINGALNHDGSTVGFYGVTPVARSSAYSPTNVTTDRAYDANATTIDELADVLGTLIADLQLTGIIG